MFDVVSKSVEPIGHGDLLSELWVAVSARNTDAIGELIIRVAASAPEHRVEACTIVAELGEDAAGRAGWAKWADDLFILPSVPSGEAQPAAQPKAKVPAEPEAVAQPVGEVVKRRRIPAEGAKAERLAIDAEIAKIVDALAKPKAEAKAEPGAKAGPKPALVATAKAKAKPGFPDAPLPPPGATALERLTYPRGLLGHAVQYIYDTANYPDRVMSLAGAISALAKGLDRKVLGPTGNSTVLFNLVIAATGAGKQHILNCIRMLLRAMGEEEVIAASGIASVQSIEEILEGRGEKKGKPSVLVVIDEYGSFLSRISSKGQTGNVAEIPGTLQTLWGWPPQLEWQGSMKVGKDVVNVYGPAFSIFGSSTEHAFFAAMKRKEVASGFVNRHLLLNAGRGAPGWIDPKYEWLKCPGWLVKALKEVAGPPAPIDNRPLRSDKWVVVKDFRRIGWGAGAKERWQEFEREIRALPTDERELWIRAPDMAIRIATVVAVFRGMDVVECEDLEWGIEFARHSTKQLAHGLDKHMLEEYEQADLVEYIRGEFRRKDVLTQGQIRKLCERKTDDHRKIDAAIYHLEICDEIEEVEAVGPGRPTKRWQWIGTGGVGARK